MAGRREFPVRGASLATEAGDGTTPAPCSGAKVPPDEALRLFQKADAVCFDVDSTVIQKEGIDEMAAFLGKAAEVAELTASAMGGSVPFHEALEQRLAVMQPTLSKVQEFLEADASRIEADLTPGVAALMDGLAARGTDVYLVSGGFTQMIHPLARHLGIPESRVFANTILFDDEGNFAGHDTTAPTSRAGGKADVVRRLRAAHGYSVIAMVGDGATDLEARPPADVFLGFGGVAARERVRVEADLWETSFLEANGRLLG